MCQVLKSKVSLDLVDLGCVTRHEDLVNVCNYCLHVIRAVLRHVLPDGLEVLPEVSGEHV